MKRGAKTLIILSGGRGSRFGGDKGLSDFEGARMIEHVLDSLSPLADEVIVSVAPGKKAEYAAILSEKARVVEDEAAFQGPLLGLKNALRHVTGDIVLLVACDMPFIDAELYRFLLGKMGSKEAAMPSIGGYSEPMMGVYLMQSLIEAVDKATTEGERKLSAMLVHMDVLTIPEEVLRKAGLDNRIFTNMNVHPRNKVARRPQS
jgi:molybdopterin-guanine dinucleotide biosynthesis protein A